MQQGLDKKKPPAPCGSVMMKVMSSECKVKACVGKENVHNGWMSLSLSIKKQKKHEFRQHDLVLLSKEKRCDVLTKVPEDSYCLCVIFEVKDFMEHDPKNVRLQVMICADTYRSVMPHESVELDVERIDK